MPSRPTADAAARARVLAALREHGLLFEADREAPSVASIVAGEPIAGSWWSHPAGRAIFATCAWLHDHADVTCAKLVRGKRTYVHRKLWPALLGVATAREPWQTDALPARALELLESVERAGSLRLDELATTRNVRPLRAAADQLEARLLVQVESVHTERGAHERQLASWRDLAARIRTSRKERSPTASRAEIERAVRSLLGRDASGRDLPWLERPRARRAP